MSGIEQLVDEAVASRIRPSVAIGVVASVSDHAAFGQVAVVTIQPSGSKVEARILYLAAAPGQGDFAPVKQGAEVVLLFPGSDRNRAVAIPGLAGGGRSVPSGWDQATRHIVAADGVKVTKTDGAVAEAVVLESLLPDLATSLGELSGILKALGMPTPNTDSLVASLGAGFRSASLSTDKAGV